jgi:type IV pilus assembly protein PilA
MLQRLRNSQESEKGFTLIELLVVVLIIAILAAIAIPVFLRQRERGWRSQMQSDLKNAATAIETFGTDNNGDYSGVNGFDEAQLEAADLGYNNTAGVTLNVAATSSDYCITATHASLTTETWVYDSDTGEPDGPAGSC